MLIGITGGIGSGKSSVGNLLVKWGYSLYNSDDWAKYLVENNSEIKHKITKEFGEKAYTNGTYNRNYIADLVFQKSKKLQKLNSIIHPIVAKHFQIWKENQKGNFIFKESALLFELNLDKKCDKSLLVTANTNIRRQRAMQRDHKTLEQTEAIINKQMPELQKILRADYVIVNNSDLNTLENNARKLIDKLEKTLR